ncbi:MAG TPA: nuclear transport factor 2 family protein [Egibacteraceae bacterium]
MRRNRAVVLGLLALLLMLGTSATVSAGPRPQAAVRAPVVDVQGAIEATHRWALGYDQRDIAMMRDAFTDDARFVFHLSTGGDPLVFEGIDEVMELFTSSLESQDDVRRHVTTNHIVERLGPRRVRVTSYLTLLVIDDPTQPPRLQSSGVYTDTIVHERDGVWRIQERILRLDTPS